MFTSLHFGVFTVLVQATYLRRLIIITANRLKVILKVCAESFDK